MTQRKMRVAMIVEAGQTGLSTRKMLLETVGYNVISAVSCRQALELAEKWPADILLFDTDVHDLPVADTINKLKQKYRGVPVYLLTAQPWAPEELRGIADGVLEKMSDPVEMVKVVEERLGY